eukprot:CCRYP_010762-RA/>CCRYP_010762-RA protein AED:0.25 eAED:0.25 QI:3397/1/1/1/0/0/3/346/79
MPYQALFAKCIMHIVSEEEHIQQLLQRQPFLLDEDMLILDRSGQHTEHKLRNSIVRFFLSSKTVKSSEYGNDSNLFAPS